MPLIDTAGLISPGIGPQEAAITYDPDKGGPLGPSFGQLFSTAVDQGIWGTLGHAFSDSVMSGLSGDHTTFDPFPAIQGTQYEAYANKFVDVNTQADFELRKQQIDRELANKATMASVGGAESFMASLAAGFVDPLMLLPVGGAALEGGTAMMNAARAALMTSLTVGAGTIGEEIVLSHLQATRTPEESITNILAATALSGLLGGALHVAFGGRGAPPALAERFAKDVDGVTDPNLFGGGAAANLSAGVASKKLNFRELKVDSALGAEKLALDPRMRTAQSPSVVTRQVGADLAETPYYLAGNRDGVSTPTAVETLIKQHQAPLAEGLGDLDSAFLKYRTGKGASGPIGAGMAKAGLGIGDLAGQGGGKLDFIRFKEEVAMAMRNGDVHAIPEVAQAAKTLREKIFNPLRDLAIKHGLLPEGIKPEFADTYLTRLYNTEKITANRNAFIEHLTDWFENEQLRSPEPLSRGELKTRAEEITNTILRSPGNRTLYDIEPNLRGPLKERTLAIPDNVLAPWLVNDVERIAKTYTRTMAADVELAAKFGRADMADQIKEIVDSYDRLAAKTEDGPKQSALKKQMDRDVKDIEGMRDRIRGTYGMPDDPHGLASRTFRVVRTLNFVRMLGGMTLSAIPDVGHLVMVHGLQRVLGDGVAPLISSLKAVKLANAETHLAGTALDLVLETRAMMLADIWEDFGRYSKFERSVQWVGDKMGGVSLMGLWNSSIKQFTGLITQARTLQAIEAIASGKGAPAQEVRRLASLGIDAEMAGRIAKEFAAHGDKEGGVYQANTSAWGDAEAARAYRGMLAKEVDQIIVTPGQDRPLWVNKLWGSPELGQIISQFKSFTFSSTSKVLINGLQQRDANALQGLIVMASLGMLATYLKGSLNGSQMPQNAAQWIEAGVDQSGMLGWIMDANNIAERTVGVGANPAISAVTGAPARSNRYSSSGVFGALLGPTAGLAEDSLHMGYDAAHGNFGSADVHRGRRMIPFNNLFYAKWLFDAGERATDEAFGLPPPRSATPPQ